MQKIIIIGCPGSGKSTLAKVLGEKLNLPVVHLDKIFWKENWVSLSKEEFKEKLLVELKKDRWILDGNFASTLPLRLEYADHVIFMNYPTLTCFFRVLKRVITFKGKTRPDMAEGCQEKFDKEFLKYVLTFKKERLSKMRETLNNSTVLVTEIKSDRALKKFLKSL